MDCDETFKISVIFVISMNLGEGRCTLKHLHALHKHTRTEESPDVIIPQICLHTE